MAFLFKTNESKGILISLLIHTTLLGAVLVKSDDPVKIADKEKTVAVDLTCVHFSKELPEKTKPKPVVKKKEKLEKVKKKPKAETKEKNVKKDIKKYKPILKKKIIKKEQMEPAKKISKDIKKDIKKVQKQESKKSNNTILDKKLQKQSFIKTNFTVIRDMILSNLRYPSIAKRMGWSGSVKIKLVVDTAGKIIDYSIVESSKRKQLDKAALKAVQRVLDEKLPKPETKTTIILPIVFKIK